MEFTRAGWSHGISEISTLDLSQENRIYSKQNDNIKED
jgi:hypothetical protein